MVEVITEGIRELWGSLRRDGGIVKVFSERIRELVASAWKVQSRNWKEGFESWISDWES
jgi:hypothetical protein